MMTLQGHQIRCIMESRKLFSSAKLNNKRQVESDRVRGRVEIQQQLLHYTIPSSQSQELTLHTLQLKMSYNYYQDPQARATPLFNCKAKTPISNNFSTPEIKK